MRFTSIGLGNAAADQLVDTVSVHRSLQAVDDAHANSNCHTNSKSHSDADSSPGSTLKCRF